MSLHYIDFFFFWSVTAFNVVSVSAAQQQQNVNQPYVYVDPLPPCPTSPNPASRSLESTKLRSLGYTAAIL